MERFEEVPEEFRALRAAQAELRIPEDEVDPGDLDVVPIDPAAWSRPDRREFAVHVPLWTREEGPSDLSLELTLVDAQDGNFAVEVDNIEVL